jgi:hypothetical protein
MIIGTITPVQVDMADDYCVCNNLQFNTHHLTKYYRGRIRGTNPTELLKEYSLLNHQTPSLTIQAQVGIGWQQV